MTIIWFGKWWSAQLGPFSLWRHYWRGRWTPFVTVTWRMP